MRIQIKSIEDKTFSTYKAIVRGKKNACYALFGSMPCYDSKTIFEGSGTDEEYELKFQGDCKNDIDAYCDPWEGEKPVVLPEDHEEAMTIAADQCSYKTLQERSEMFQVEVLCNSAVIDMGQGADIFVHYIKGAEADDECPEDLYGMSCDEEFDGEFSCEGCGIGVSAEQYMAHG